MLPSGFLLIDKPLGLSSNHALSALKRKGIRMKIGHTGTLDPFATGLLVVGLGEALKFIQYLQEEPKVYEATLTLGEKTDTLDCTGTIIETRSVPLLSLENIEKVFEKIKKQTSQIPPMFSAKKKDGQRLYDLARQGQEIERAPQTIAISSLELIHWDATSISFRTSVSKGTYIRVLGEDIAQELGTLGHLKSLRRISAGSFSVSQSMSLDEEVTVEKIIPLDIALSHWTSVELSNLEVTKILCGQKIYNNIFEKYSGIVRVHSLERFLGMGEIQQNCLTPLRLMAGN